MIPQDRIDPVALKAIGYYPEPNRAGHGDQREQLCRQQRRTARPRHHRGPGRSHAERGRSPDGALLHQRQRHRRTRARSGTRWRIRRRTRPTCASRACSVPTRVSFSPTLANELRVTYLRRKFIDQRFGFGENLAGDDRPARRQRKRLPGVHDSGLRVAEQCQPGARADADPRPADPRVALVVQGQARLQVRVRGALRRQLRDARPRIVRRALLQPALHQQQLPPPTPATRSRRSCWAK